MVDDTCTDHFFIHQVDWPLFTSSTIQLLHSSTSEVDCSTAETQHCIVRKCDSTINQHTNHACGVKSNSKIATLSVTQCLIP